MQHLRLRRWRFILWSNLVACVWLVLVWHLSFRAAFMTDAELDEPPALVRPRLSLFNEEDSQLADVANKALEHARSDVFMDSYTTSTENFLKETRILIRLMGNAADRSFTWHTQAHSNQSVTTQFAVHRGCRRGGAERLRVMVACGMHAREMFSSDFCRSWMLYSAMTVMENDARLGAGGDLCDRSLELSIAPIDWIFVPVVNPSGRDLVASAYVQHAANASKKSWLLCLRGNSQGVDLNRNWRRYDGVNAVGTHHAPHLLEQRELTKEENPGPDSFSEAETVNMRSILEKYNPHVLLSIHTGAMALLYPYDDVVEPPEHQPQLQRVVDWLATLSRCRSFQPHRCRTGQGSRLLYVSRGTCGDYAYRHMHSEIPLTMEVYQGPTKAPERYGYPPSEEWQDDPWRCFRYFNPLSSQLVDALLPWKSLWRGLYYLSPSDESELRQILRIIKSTD